MLASTASVSGGVARANTNSPGELAEAMRMVACGSIRVCQERHQEASKHFDGVITWRKLNCVSLDTPSDLTGVTGDMMSGAPTQSSSSSSISAEVQARESESMPVSTTCRTTAARTNNSKRGSAEDTTDVGPRKDYVYSSKPFADIGTAVYARFNSRSGEPYAGVIVDFRGVNGITDVLVRWCDSDEGRPMWVHMSNVFARNRLVTWHKANLAHNRKIELEIAQLQAEAARIFSLKYGRTDGSLPPGITHKHRKEEIRKASSTPVHSSAITEQVSR